MALGPELVTNGTFNTNLDGWEPGQGTWSADNGGSCRFDYAAGFATILQQNNLVLEIGKTYRVAFDFIRDASGGSAQIFLATIALVNATSTGSYEDEITLASLPTSTVNFNSTSIRGYLDNVSVKEVLPDTTTVEVEWIDSISAAATGNKIYRDDVEIADIANGVQIYQDATAEIGTEYKYEVQAYSATDETTQEVLGVNVQFITTA